MGSLAVYFLTLAIYCAHGYENVAINKPTWQSQQYIQGNALFDSSNAVDGQKSDLSAFGGQCVVSAPEYRTATWWVNLESVFSIHDIKIYYRTDNVVWGASNGYTGRFLGFFVYVSNTTSHLDGHLCFHDRIYNRSTIPAVVDISCPEHGQYVIYHNQRLSNVIYSSGYSTYAYNELCEVEVYGCRTGFYGSNCSLPCPDNCRYCHIETGVCSWCKAGFQGHECETECSNGTFGNNCDLKCSENCKDSLKCNGTTGECEGGCRPGWKGLRCTNECDGSFYGKDCSLPCGHCLKSIQCHPLNGSCLNGCAAGYLGLFCNETCDPGWYGPKCEERCGYCKGYGPCHHEAGSCFGLCEPGYSGYTCKENVFTQMINYLRGIYSVVGENRNRLINVQNRIR